MEKSKSKSRAGRHPDYYVMLGGMVPPRKKAIAMVTAAVVSGNGKITVLDLMWKGVENIARMFGVLDGNGHVTEKYKDIVDMTEETIGVNQKKRREKHA